MERPNSGTTERLQALMVTRPTIVGLVRALVAPLKMTDYSPTGLDKVILLDLAQKLCLLIAHQFSRKAVAGKPI